ncbi:hypothetical protein GCM10011584_14070 [Nocardioides phosphati]|uniref:DUF2568 domain-containing protein n=1 Tax=Nocardioides phosphati TaxID=1867775 RepID=A0ABQ2N9B7_9ACTN|nr:YrdB family protein [Nocardioides phosphati]GGO88030.1 hypothetical protein GCM10011584_14070 [Nocardioides phosphati]
MRAFALTVLALVFLDELAAMAAFGVWGWQVGGDLRWLLAVLAPLGAMLTWFFLASPKARYGGGLVRPVAKVIVFGLASVALWSVGEHGWAAALLVGSVVVNTLAQTPPVLRVLRELETQDARRTT